MTDLDLRGGIRSRLTTGSSDTSHLNWWGRRWIELIQPMVDHPHYTRGKSCAKRGHVLSLDIKPGLVAALVQSDRPTPYIVRFGFNVLTSESLELVISRFKERSVFAAELLAGRLPHEVEEVFREAGIRIFPNELRIRTFKCTCPSSDTICEHIIAVYMLLGEAFDNDPFLLLKLYGLDKAMLIRELSGEISSNADDTELVTATDALEPGEIEELLSENDDFDNWYGKAQFKMPVVKEIKKAEAYSVMHEFPFWRGVNPFLETIKEYYTKAANYSYELLTGEKRITVGRPKKY